MPKLRLVHDLTTDAGWKKYKQDMRFRWVLTGLDRLKEQVQSTGDPAKRRAYIKRQEYAIGLASTDTF